ncbi:MAG: clostripain-related cysteine peptidase [Chloroflexota bacterium]
MSYSERMHDPDGAPGGVGPAPERRWTLLIYMAGDNSLEDFGRQDLEELKSVGSTPEVAVVAQFDRMFGGVTRRYYLRQGTSLAEDEVAEQPADAINTGDPRELARFIAWGDGAYPAPEYAQLGWNHGTGWREDDIYQRPAAQGASTLDRRRRIAQIARDIAARPGAPVLFGSSIDAILAKGIAYDDTSADFLDNAELKRALDGGLLFAGLAKFSLLGFDACLMSMLEVAYQVRGHCRLMVGSQEAEPATGWPYGAILQELVARPSMAPAELAETIVDAFLAAYGPEANVTQSALDLDYLGPAVAALNELCAYALEHQDDCELILGRATRRAQRFTDPDYKDLLDACHVIVEASADLPEFQAHARALAQLLEPAGADRLVLATGHHGPRLRTAGGLSIYFPVHAVSPFYRRLDFAGESLWDELLHALTGG